jgi:hypothetical protein
MPRYLIGGRREGVAIAVCDRCKFKRFLSELSADPNFPGLRVCVYGCVDQYDPWRLPARQPEQINLRFPRPDVPLTGVADTDYLVLATEDEAPILTESGEYIGV